MLAFLGRFAPAAVLALALLPACMNLLGPGTQWQRVVGVIEIGGDQPPPLHLPAEVRAGVPFTAMVVTWGSGSCTRADGAEVVWSAAGAQITPYDREAVRGVCTDDLRPYPREVTLRFEQPGETEVRVVGRPILTDEPVHFTVRITVLP
jgi:hypothetical protein